MLIMAGNQQIAAIEPDGTIDRNGSKTDSCSSVKILTKTVAGFQSESVVNLN